MISYRNVTKIYPDQSVALRNVSFDIKKGEFVSLVGKSGAGKTTLLKLLLAEERPTEGEVLFDDLLVHQLSPSSLPVLRRNIGMVFQDYKLLNSKTAYENVAYVMEVIGLEEDTIARDVREVLEIVGLGERARHYPFQLSGGEKQRVAIARALIHRPNCIVANNNKEIVNRIGRRVLTLVEGQLVRDEEEGKFIGV